ncbi:glycoside hydrolase family 32 protein [Auraticoccus sp. F435]|uniref:beta-fructofuranosidase n=1 Tax=Auraticoccus cholistanensis TaxID=2656650 RepID=A0A6A9UV42_9ACTN|nr:glycoside hydrolase family 32 protein [Auraticoccus cholistanensis]
MSATSDARPRWHIRPASGWLNDPNGLARVDGRYHVFFQHHPTSVTHQAIHWGHASSTDLVRWREEPIALTPRPGRPDAHGCWTGCLVDDAGTPTIAYSAVADASGRADVVLARSDRTLREWHVDGHATVPMPEVDGVTAVRDPFVFVHRGVRWGVQGAGAVGGEPRLLLWRCDDLTRWEPRGTLVDLSDPVLAEVAPAEIWECPNLVPVGDDWVLVVSLWRTVDGRHALSGVRWVVGDLVPDGGGLRFVGARGGVLDEGPTFYAPQLLLDTASSRVLLWGWAWEHGRDEEQVARQGWAGVLTCPRELDVVDGAVVVRPAPELDALRGPELRPDADGRLTASSFELQAAGPGGLAVTGAGGDVELARWGAGARVLVDGSLVEVFEADGRTFTTRGYPVAGWRVRGDARVLELAP